LPPGLGWGYFFGAHNFFHGRTAAVLSHGLVKEDRIPPGEIDRAIARKARFEADPEAHTYKLELK